MDNVSRSELYSACLAISTFPGTNGFCCYGVDFQGNSGRALLDQMWASGKKGSCLTWFIIALYGGHCYVGHTTELNNAGVWDVWDQIVCTS